MHDTVDSNAAHDVEKSAEAEFHKTVADAGFNTEVQKVVTTDGFVLKMFRLVDPTNPTPNKPVVFF